MKRLWSGIIVLASVLALAIGVGPAYGQGGDACGVIVETALNMAGQLCADLGRNQACYGHALLEAELQPGSEGVSFARLGDRTGLDTLSLLRLSALDETSGQWGVALLKAQASLPDTLPGQNVTLVLFGQTELGLLQTTAETDSGPSVAVIVLAGAVIVDQPSLAGGPLYGPLSADTPFIAEGQSADGLWLWVRLPEGGAGWAMGMQSSGETGGLPVVDASGQAVGSAGDGAATAFYFTSGMGDAPCPLAPASGLLIQSPQDAGEVHLRLDGVDVSLASTAYVQATTDGEWVFYLLEGQASVSTAGVT